MNAAVIAPPSIGLAVTELHRALLELSTLGLSRPLLNKLAPGDGHAVLLLPGFLGDDGYNASLRRFLEHLGYQASGWEQGRNLGPRDDLLVRVVEHIQTLAQESGGKISLVGHSLGGIYARELAKEVPELVRQVISLGSPFGPGREEGSYPSRLFSRMNPADELEIDKDLLADPPPVPTTAVFSKGDGVCNWKTCVQDGYHSQVQNIRVWGSHCGLTVNPLVWLILADRLAQDEDDWKPFKKYSVWS